ncbi:MAG: family 20 glycosylhydrolase [Clostridia bacterium]|nr:family 20 glycosylhydrolase [Clostridia bacterium]
MFFKPIFWDKREAVTLSAGYQIHHAECYAAEVLAKLGKHAHLDGSITNIIIENYLPDFCPADLGKEGYALEISKESVILYGNTAPALGFATVTLLQMAEFDELFTGTLYDAPDCSFRGYRAYLPSRDYLDDFYGMVDLIQYYKFNTLILEVGGAMEYKSHPEINVAWKAFADETHRYSGRADEIQNGYGWAKNSIHTDNAEGEILTQDEVRKLVEYCKARGLTVYPEVPTLSHSDYICLAHPEIAERQDDPYPDTYCPNHPDTYKIVFDIMEEILEVFQPDMVHIGHDETYTLAKCPRCQGKKPYELYVQDITTIHDWLAQRGIRTMMWGEKLLPVVLPDGKSHGGAGQDWLSRNGEKLEDVPPLFLCQNKLPRDILMAHWYGVFGIQYDHVYHVNGYEAIYGNLSVSHIEEWRRRITLGMKGGFCSNWGSFKPIYMQRNLQNFNLILASYALWSRDYDTTMLSEVTEEVFRECFRYHNRELDPAEIIEILHTTDYYVPYKAFYDGIFIEPEKYYLGDYKVTYTDGSTVTLPVYYGEHLSNCNAVADAKGVLSDDMVIRSSLAEAAGTSLPIRKEGKTYYKTLYRNPYPEKSIASISYQEIKKDVSVEYQVKM